MRDETLPITDWSHVGRQEYVDKNRQAIELVIEQALEDFDEEAISLAFQSQDKAVIKIIELFLIKHFSADSLPSRMPKDIKLFSQLRYFIKFKTAGKVYAGDRRYKQISQESILESAELEVENNYFKIQVLAKNLNRLNDYVAPDLIGYWLQANKKLLNGLSKSESSSQIVEIENDVSDTQKTRYKVDASFRYLYMFLNVAKHLESVELYENKYFVKGPNCPQYVAGHSESHQNKHQIRQTIKQIINQLYKLFTETDDNDDLARSLFKAIAKTAVLDVYEINKVDPYYLDYAQKLKLLKTKPSTILEQVS